MQVLLKLHILLKKSQFFLLGFAFLLLLLEVKDLVLQLATVHLFVQLRHLGQVLLGHYLDFGPEVAHC